MDFEEKTNVEMKGNEAVFKRIINAPSIPLFKAWTDPVLIPLWWGPCGFSCKVCKIDLRAGGGYKIKMFSPDDVEYTIRGSYLEIAEPDRLKFTLSKKEQPDEWNTLLTRCNIARTADPESGAKFFITVEFKDLYEKTELNILVRFSSEMECADMMNFGMADGWVQSLERLAGLVEFLS
jgi:uncharacterized protein YndB with AHSA1/START domain